MILTITIKKWGHRACLRVCRLIKWGIFTGCALKNSNHLHTELSHGYLEDTKFYLESKASFLDISSIASVKLFLISCCGNISLFRAVPWLAWSPRLGQNTPNWELFSKKRNRVPLSNFFSSSNMFFIRLFLANTWKKKSGVTVLV